MFDSDRKLRHLPFFEDIATREEDSPEWRASTAGLVVLRLVDTWLADGRVASDDSWALQNVRRAVEEVDDGTPIRAILGRVLDALETQRPDVHVVITPLMAYGQALEYDAEWTLAADVYHTILSHVHPVADSDATIAAYLRLGSCYRNLNQKDDAEAAFALAARVAGEVGDIMGILRARVGEARVAILRGNLPAAEQILDDTVGRAKDPGLRDVRSRALHERSNVAYFRKQYDLAVRFGYEALADSQSPTERDRILGDIAVAFMDLGLLSAARDAYLVLSATAQEQYARWVATLNLLEIASQSHIEPLFEQYRRHLIKAPLPPYLATFFQLALGQGYRRFGDFNKARGHLEGAVALAETHGLSQFLFQAEEALLELETPRPPRPTPGEISLDVEEVAEEIRKLRDSVAV